MITYNKLSLVFLVFGTTALLGMENNQANRVLGHTEAFLHAALAGDVAGVKRMTLRSTPGTLGEQNELNICIQEFLGYLDRSNQKQVEMVWAILEKASSPYILRDVQRNCSHWVKEKKAVAQKDLDRLSSYPGLVRALFMRARMRSANRTLRLLTDIESEVCAVETATK